MDSPPSFSGHSEAPLLSEDSGLIITSGSISSDSVSGWLHIASELQESDYDEKSLSLSDLQDMSERMCGDNFNTVKKGPTKINMPAIEPPPQFQDSPIIGRAGMKDEDKRYKRGETRLCSSQSSLATQSHADDTSFITQAISHDTLTASDIADMYNVPFDSDIYAIPFDVIKPLNDSSTSKPQHLYRRSRSKQIIQRYSTNKPRGCNPQSSNMTSDMQVKRHSVPSTSMSKKCISAVSISHDSEPMHMTLPEVQKYLQKLYSSSSESDTISRTIKKSTKSKSGINTIVNNNSFKYSSLEGNLDGISKQENTSNDSSNNNNFQKNGNNSNNKKKNFITSNIRSKKCNRDKTKVSNSISSGSNNAEGVKDEFGKRVRSKKSPVKGLSLNLKQTLCNFFGLKRNENNRSGYKCVAPPPVNRALPPLPQSSPNIKQEDTPMDFASSLQKVKDYGWYWGPVSVETAEKILSDEPDGSFIVRDSSDDHYIFTLTFKLNGMRHVRIEHDQDSFCFGSQMFKAQTIVEFIENAVETSRSGRYLFFLNLRPVLGPIRVQLLYPVSRFKRVQSLQHMCRFVILKYVRRDLLHTLPLPKCLLDYLSARHYYAEMLNDV